MGCSLLRLAKHRIVGYHIHISLLHLFIEYIRVSKSRYIGIDIKPTTQDRTIYFSFLITDSCTGWIVIKGIKQKKKFCSRNYLFSKGTTWAFYTCLLGVSCFQNLFDRSRRNVIGALKERSHKNHLLAFHYIFMKILHSNGSERL